MLRERRLDHPALGVRKFGYTGPKVARLKRSSHNTLFSFSAPRSLPRICVDSFQIIPYNEYQSQDGGLMLRGMSFDAR